MATKSKVCLIAALVCLVAGGIIWWGPWAHKIHPSLNILFPLGAILMGLFLVSRLFEKEEHVYGDDQRKEAAKAGKPVVTPPSERI